MTKETVTLIDLVKNYSSMVRRTKVSAIRELLKYKDIPGLISFAGGFPSSDLFPSEQLKEIGIKIMTEMPEVCYNMQEQAVICH